MEGFFSTIDWAKVRDSSCSFRFEELVHYSRMKLDPCTIHAAEILFSKFDVPEDTKVNLAAAWQTQLKEHLVNDSVHRVLGSLARSDHGSLCLGLCAAINTYYRIDTAPIVLRKLGELAAMPADLALTLTTWSQLAGACESLRLPPSFQSMVDNYTALGRYGSESAADVARRNFGMQLEHIGPQRLLEVLQFMSAICVGREESHPLCLMGIDAGWVAAMADWFFKLKIDIEGIDGKIIHSNTGDTGHLAQMTIAFQNRGRPAEGPEVEDAPLFVK